MVQRSRGPFVAAAGFVAIGGHLDSWDLGTGAHDATRYFDYHHTANDTLDKVDAAALRFNVAARVTFLYFGAETETSFGPVEPDEEARVLPIRAHRASVHAARSASGALTDE